MQNSRMSLNRPGIPGDSSQPDIGLRAEAFRVGARVMTVHRINSVGFRYP